MTSINMTKQLHQQADVLLNGGRLSEARALYEQISKLDENDSEAWLMKGAIDGETGKVNEAISHIKRAITLDPGYADAYHTLAYLLKSTGSIEEARDSLKKAVELDPEYGEAWLMLAGIQGRLKNYTDAELCSRNVLKLDSSSIEALMILANALSAQGNIKEAMTSYKKLIQLKPNHQAALSRLGVIQLQLKDFDGAEESLGKALSLNSNDIPAKLCLARVFVEHEQFDDAIQQLQDVLMGQPETEDAWKGLMLIYNELDELENWLDFSQQLTVKHPESGLVWFYHGNVLERKEERLQALDSYQKATNFSPHLHDAWSRKGVVCMALERFDEAQDCFREALNRGSDAPISYCGYGRMLRLKGRFAESEKNCRIAVEKEPGKPTWLCELGRVLLDQGCLNEAADIFKKVLDLGSSDKEGVAGLAQVYERQAKHGDAYEIIKPFLDDDPGGQIVCIFGKVCNRIGKQEEALSQIEVALQDENLSTLERVELHYLSAEIHSKHHNYAVAFDHYNLANTLKPVDFDLQSHVRFIDDMIELFSEKSIANLPKATICSEKPVFIVGMPRSGTSLLEQMLACHDDVYGAGELAEINDIAWKLGFSGDMPRPHVGQIKTVAKESLNQLANTYLAKLDSLSTGEKRVTDKMPGNFMWLGLIQLLFPGARIINMRRNPLDTCLSCYFTHFAGIHQYAYNLEDLGHYYCEYERLMQHWRNVLSIPILDVEYEELVTNTEDVSRSILEFCDLSWSPEVLNFHKSERVVATRSYLQVRKPMYTSSIGKWEKYAEFLEPLRGALADCSE